jgi:hypothetical protein
VLTSFQGSAVRSHPSLACFVVYANQRQYVYMEAHAMFEQAITNEEIMAGPKLVDIQF